VQGAWEQRENHHEAPRVLAGCWVDLRDAPAFVELGEAGVAVDDATRHQRRVQLVE